MGRPTEYKDDYPRMAEVACREGGFTNPKLGKLFGVSAATIHTWGKLYPEFLDAIKRGKDDWDTLKVEKTLLKRAMGFSYTETTQEPAKLGSKEMTVTKKVKKLVVPDTTAQIFWLKNRQPARWRDTKNIEHSGEVGLKQRTDEELDNEILKLAEGLDDSSS